MEVVGKYCSRCGRRITTWEDGWPNYGYIKLGIASQSFAPLYGDSYCASEGAFQLWNDMQTKIADAINDTPFIDIAAQQIVLMWGQGYTFDSRDRYTLCGDCQTELFKVLGNFFRVRDMAFPRKTPAYIKPIL